MSYGASRCLGAPSRRCPGDGIGPRISSIAITDVCVIYHAGRPASAGMGTDFTIKWLAPRAIRNGTLTGSLVDTLTGPLAGREQNCRQERNIGRLAYGHAGRYADLLAGRLTGRTAFR